MSNAELVGAINTIAFALFAVLLAAGAARTFARLVYYRRHRARRPRLLNRDAVMIGGLTFAIGLILLSRATGTSSQFRESVAWALLTDLPALLAVAVYCWFEYRVIERGDP